MKTILVTGGAGFIGSNFIRYYLKAHRSARIINLDKLTYAGNLENLDEVSRKFRNRYCFAKADITNPKAVEAVFSGKELPRGWKKPEISTVFHFAAESHVDRSIVSAVPFLKTNVIGTHVMLEQSRRHGVNRFVHVSTDEVYGHLGKRGKFRESTPLAPRSPYAASKASSDLMVRSFCETFDFPAIITRCSNNYGPFQFPEKLIPLMIWRARNNRPLPVYGKGENIRDWIYVDDHCRALDLVARRGCTGEVYNIGGECERRNIDVVHRILKLMNRPASLITYVEDRLGHDFRYAIDISKIHSELGWKPRLDFEEGLEKTLQWYERNSEWVDHVTSGTYRHYYRSMYANRKKS